MNDETINISIDLRRKLHDVMKDFWKDHPNQKMDTIFIINSMVISSLIAQLVFSLFKKDSEISPQLAYIDEICKLTKEQLKEGKFHINMGIQ